MMYNHTYHNIECLDLTTDFIGTAMIEGKKVFVENFLPSERADIRITEIKAKYLKGKVERLLKASDMRDHSLAHDFPNETFGGCDLQMINYPYQLKIKKQLIEKMAKLQDRDHHYCFDKIVPAPEPMHYRNKIYYRLYIDATGKIKAGFFRKGTHELIEAGFNILAKTPIADMLTAVLQKLNAFRVPIGSKADGVHGLKAVMFRYAEASNQLMIIFIATAEQVQNITKVAKMLYDEEERVQSVYLNVNPQERGDVLSDQSLLLVGNPAIEDRMMNNSVLVTPRTFYQVNTKQAATIYQQIKDWISDIPKATILDLYTGTGAIALALAPVVGVVKGVDIVKEAINIAKMNAQKNNVQNVAFVHGDVFDFLASLPQESEDLVAIIDPLRNGCTPQFITALTQLRPKKVIYISCNPKSLIRDLKIFRVAGYVEKEMKLYDMFPFTLHVECAVLMNLA